MAEPSEEPDRERVIDELVKRSGATWPRSDAEIDRWLSAQPLAADERQWVEAVVRRRMDEARGQPATVTAVRPVAAGPAAPAPVREESARPTKPAPTARLSAEDLALLDRQLVELVEARVPLPAGLEAYALDLRRGRLGRVLEALRQDLEAGLPLSSAIERRGDALPPIYRALVAAGEASGDVTGVLALLADQAETDAEVGRRFREALLYPAITLAGSLFVGYLVFVCVVPEFDKIFESCNIELPALTEATVGTSVFLRSHVALAVALPLALTAAVAALPAVGARVVARYLPSLSFRGTRARRLAELARALAGFLSRGVPATTAFRALDGAYGAILPGGLLARVVERLEGGTSIAAALKPERAFPPTFVWLVGTAETRGSLPETLRDLAGHYERRFQQWLRGIEAVLPPVLLVFGAFFVTGFVLSLFLPLFRIQTSLMQ